MNDQNTNNQDNADLAESDDQTSVDAAASEGALESTTDTAVAGKVGAAAPPTTSAPKDTGKPGVVKQTAPAQSMASVVSKMPRALPANSVFSQYEGKVTSSGQMVFNDIQGYITAMSPGRNLSLNEQIRHQISLYRAIQHATRLDTADFKIVWGAILNAFFTLRKNVFHESYVFRHFDNITLSKTDQQGFQRLLNLIVLTANPQTRQTALKQFNVNKTMQYGLTEQGVKNILNFYGL